MLAFRFGKFLHNEAGATSIEYALIASIVSISIVAGLLGVKAALVDGSYESVVKGIEEANN